MVVGIDESMTFLQVEHLVDLSSKYQAVATHQELIGRHR